MVLMETLVNFGTNSSIKDIRNFRESIFLDHLSFILLGLGVFLTVQRRTRKRSKRSNTDLYRKNKNVFKLVILSD